MSIKTRRCGQRPLHFGLVLFFVDMQSSIARYFCFAKSICFRFTQTRYDINPRSRSEHIECDSTYRTHQRISKILKGFISSKASKTLYIDSGVSILNIVRMFVITLITQLQRYKRACISDSSSTVTRQAL